MSLTKYTTLALLGALALHGCDDDDAPLVRVDTNATLLAEMQAALGGADAIAAASTLSYTATGTAFEPQEDPEPVAGKVSDYTYDLVYDLSGARSRQAWEVDADYPYLTEYAFTETIDGTRGKSEGTTGTFSVRFAGFGVPGDPMFSTKLAARQKTLMMASPLAIAKALADAEPDETTFGTIPVGLNTSELGFGASTPDVSLVIDPATALPLRAEILENDPLFGDVVYEVQYGNWTEVDGLQVPASLSFVLDGFTLRTETLTDIDVDPAVDEGLLTVAEDEAWPYMADEARAGHLSSQFHYRTLLQTFPIDFPVELTSQTSDLALASELVQDDPDAYRVAGDFQSHYTYAFRIGDDELLIYDSPVNDRRSAAVLARIRSDFSEAPIEYVANSHNHFDHTGGTRGNLAEGGELVVGAGSDEFMREMLARPKTVVGNPIDGRSVTVTGVADSLALGEGERRVVLYNVESLHAEEEDYLILYKPSTETIYFNDLVNPGFVFVLEGFPQEDQERTRELAQDVVDFVDGRGIAVSRYHCTHGFTDQDFDFATVRMLAGG